MTAPEILTVEQLFAASDNATAVTRIRYYLDQLDRSVQYCRERNGGICSPCIERERIAADIRSLLPVDGKT